MKSKSSLTVIFLTVFIDLLGFGLLIPILPTFASKELNISDFDIGIIIASFSLMQFFFNPIFGSLSDKFGRRPIILISLIVTSISYVWFSFANSFFMLLASRLLAGLGGSNISAAQAYIADITSDKERTKGMGLIGAAFGLGFVFGPMLGGILSEYGYRIVGYSSAGFSLIAFIFAYFSLKESLKENKMNKPKLSQLISIKRFYELKNDKQIMFLVFIYFIIVFSMANIYGTFALLGFKVYHLSDKQIGYLFGIIGIVGALIQGGIIKLLLKYFTDQALLIVGVFFMMIGLTGLPYGINFLGIAIIGGVLSIGTGILQPIILGLISKFTDEKNQGRILGLNQSISAFARVLGPLWGGFAFHYIGYQFPFLTGGLFTFFTLIFSFYLIRKNYFIKKDYHVQSR